MTNKYKISELAKDFGLTSKDIIKIVAEKTGAEKKSGAALDEKEISLVFDTLTKQNEVKSFADYFATGAESRAAAKKAREEEKNKKLAEQMAILEQLKAAAAGQNDEKAEKKPEPKKEEVKTASVKPNDEKKTAEKPAAAVSEKPNKPEEKKPEVKKQPEPKKEEKKAAEKKEMCIRDRLYADTARWEKMSLTNIAQSGIFSADRSIEEYAKNIWHISPVE